MGALYLAVLVLGAGSLVVQALMGDSHGGDGDAAGDHGEVGHADTADPVLGALLGLRFWMFFALAFGLSGALLHFFRLTPALVGLGLALGMGAGSGFGASWVLRVLAQPRASGGAEGRELVGLVGRVLVPVGKGGRGKVRVDVKGQAVDYLATADDAPLAENELVVIERISRDGVHVSRAPEELRPDEA